MMNLEIDLLPVEGVVFMSVGAGVCVGAHTWF